MNSTNKRRFNRIKSIRIITNIIVVVCLLLGVFFTVYGFMHLGNESDDAIVTYAITFVSFFVSVVALVVALKTYFSIDSVNSITSMEGNVLENKNYSVSYAEIINRLSEANNKEEYTDKVLELMEADKKSTSTCVEYADWLQEIIDNIIWIAYVDTSDTNYRTAREKLIETIDAEFEKYSELSNGLQYTLGEHIKLIKNILMYIEWSERAKKGEGSISRLEDIRCGMILNPVSKIAYYDYVGLNYHKKARALVLSQISEIAGNNTINERTGLYYSIIDSFEFDETTLTHIRILLDKSLEAFDKAKKVSDKDMLWEGYIRYNRIRVLLLKMAIFKEESGMSAKKAEKELRKVKEVREAVKYLYTDGDSYISSCFDKEIKLIDELIKAYSDYLSK